MLELPYLLIKQDPRFDTIFVCQIKIIGFSYWAEVMIQWLQSILGAFLKQTENCRKVVE